jgi:hypothetical protein
MPTTRDHVSRTKEGREGLFRPPILEQPDLALKIWSQVLVAARFWVCVLASIARWWLLRQTRNRSWLCQLPAGVVIALFFFWYLMEIANPTSFLFHVHIIWPLLLAKVGLCSWPRSARESCAYFSCEILRIDPVSPTRSQVL